MVNRLETGRAYGLHNHLSYVPIGPEPGQPRHGEVHNVCRLGDDHGPQLEAPTPMAPSAMIESLCYPFQKGVHVLVIVDRVDSEVASDVA
jgi:hypothetical protein